MSEGLISSLRPYEGSQYIQTSAAISPGSSGGGLFDDQGRLVGITTFQIIEGQNLNFALPVDWIGELPKRARVPSFEEFLAQERSAGEAKKGGLDFLNREMAWRDGTIPFIKKEDWRGLLTFSQQRVNSEPEFARAWGTLGDAYRGLQQCDQAIQAYREALRIQPEDSSAWSSLGFAYKDLQQYDQAIQAYREALRIQPNFTIAWYNLGTAYAFKGQRVMPREIYQTLRKLDPTMAEELQRFYFALRRQ